MAPNSVEFDELDSSLPIHHVEDVSKTHLRNLSSEDQKTIQKTQDIVLPGLSRSSANGKAPPLVNRSIEKVPGLFSEKPKSEKEKLQAMLELISEDVEKIHDLDPSLLEQEGVSKEELDVFTQKLRKVLKEPQAHQEKEINPGWEVLKAGLWKEFFLNQEIQKILDKIEESHDKVELLLDLNAELSGKVGNTAQLSDKAQETLAKLKERGIDLKTGKDVAVSELKETIGRSESRLRSQIQNLFSTELQAKERDKASLLEALQGVLKAWREFISRILANIARR